VWQWLDRGRPLPAAMACLDAQAALTHARALLKATGAPTDPKACWRGGVWGGGVGMCV